LSADKIGSKNNFLPNATPSTVCGLFTGIIGGKMFLANNCGISRGNGVGVKAV
jgi:hypothetical protein